jgi:hypothetical protein
MDADSVRQRPSGDMHMLRLEWAYLIEILIFGPLVVLAIWGRVYYGNDNAWNFSEFIFKLIKKEIIWTELPVKQKIYTVISAIIFAAGSAFLLFDIVGRIFPEDQDKRAYIEEAKYCLIREMNSGSCDYKKCTERLFSIYPSVVTSSEIRKKTDYMRDPACPVQANEKPPVDTKAEPDQKPPGDKKQNLDPKPSGDAEQQPDQMPPAYVKQSTKPTPEAAPQTEVKPTPEAARQDRKRRPITGLNPTEKIVGMTCGEWSSCRLSQYPSVCGARPPGC